jgi:hypothetical protein
MGESKGPPRSDKLQTIVLSNLKPPCDRTQEHSDHASSSVDRTIPITIQKEFCYVRSPAMNSTVRVRTQKSSPRARHFILLYSSRRSIRVDYELKQIHPYGCASYTPLKFPLNKTLNLNALDEQKPDNHFEHYDDQSVKQLNESTHFFLLIT